MIVIVVVNYDNYNNGNKDAGCSSQIVSQYFGFEKVDTDLGCIEVLG